MQSFEVVTFVNDEVSLDVNVSPSEDTVWLSLNDMCLLFDRDKSVISRHIKNVISDNNLDVNQVVAKNATTGNDGKTYMVSFYNLEVIIPVGYKVHSQNGILFRKWANKILKEYMIKGYVINEERTLITNENYINLINKVDSIDKRLSLVEKANLEKDKIFFDGEIFDAKSFISELIFTANISIVLIDAYADIKALEFFKNKKQGVSLSIYHSSKAKLSVKDVADFNAQYGDCSAHINDKYHDRFIIIDDKETYHIGASLNYAGKKVFAITKIEGEEILESIKRNL
ncbi:MAG: virulence RhuM family protein [Bacilli bacterium]|nr:virulence RhuM family protein [Bacilli bacterium]